MKRDDNANTIQVWMCGGRVVWVPCSRVGHVYRALVPYNTGHFASQIQGGDLVTRNLKRVVEVWLDQQHKEYFYTRQPTARQIEVGDLSQQLELREKVRGDPWQTPADCDCFSAGLSPGSSPTSPPPSSPTSRHRQRTRTGDSWPGLTSRNCAGNQGEAEVTVRLRPL